MINQPLHKGFAKENVQVAIEEKVPFINYSLGKPWFIDQVHAYGGKVIGTIAIAKHAVSAVKLGCDAVVGNGSRGGGPRRRCDISDSDSPGRQHGQYSHHRRRRVFTTAGGWPRPLPWGRRGSPWERVSIVTQESLVHQNFKQLCLNATEQGHPVQQRVRRYAGTSPEVAHVG